MPVSVDTLPSGEVTDIFNKPSIRPIQWSTGWPIRATKPPEGTWRSKTSQLTRSNSAGVSARPHKDFFSSSIRLALAMGRATTSVIE